MNRRTIPGERRRRSAVVLVVVIAALVVTSTLMLALTRESITSRRQGRLERQLRQTECLLDAGIRRAVTSLVDDTDYAGELWQPTSALPAFDHVRVEIAIEPADPAASRTVTVTASLGRGDSSAFRTQRSHSFLAPPPSAVEPPSPVAPSEPE